MKHSFLFISFLIVSAFCYGQKVKPALKLIKGNTYNMVTSAHSSVKEAINGQANNVDMTIAGTTSFKVLNADDSLYYMEVSYTQMSMKIQLPTGTVAFDSQKKDASDVMSTLLGAMLNKPFTAKLTKSGKVRSVDNVENMISSVIDGVTQVQGPQKEQLKAQFLQSFGATAIKGNIEMGTAIFPENAVSKNDKWNINTQLQGLMSAKLASVYQLTDVTPATFIIHGDTNITTDDSADFKALNGMPVKYKLTGKMTSDIIADKATGWITHATIKQEMSGNVEVKDNPQLPGGMTFPMSINNETVTTDR